jgi:hypothetical protein
MAYVRKTDTLQYDVINRVREMRSAALAPYQTNKLEIGTPEYNDMRKDVVAATWKDAPDLQHKVPDTWCGEPTRADIKLHNSEGTRVARFSIENTSANPMRFSPAYRRQSYPDVDVYTAHLTGAAKTWADSIAGFEAKQAEVNEKFNVVEQQLKGYMQQHASLNAMITEMPEFEMYVPDKYMQKYRAKSAPRAKVERPTNVENLNIDVDALAAAAITHRMVSSNGSS